MSQIYAGRKRIRHAFGAVSSVMDMPNLIGIQKSSYDEFLQMGVAETERLDQGLQSVFNSVFPIDDFSDTSRLEFVTYQFEQSKYDVEECRQRGMTFSVPLKVKLRLIVYDIDEETEAKSIKDIKEQSVYMGDLPLMTDNGTFVINGTERVVVSQMHRSPGVLLDHDRGKTHASGKLLFFARIIPYRGSWLDFEFDAKDILHVRIDRRRKMPATTLLHALGFDNQEILELFYETITFTRKNDRWITPFNPKIKLGTKLIYNLVDEKKNRIVVEAGKKLTPRLVKKIMEEGLENIVVSEEELLIHHLSAELVNENTGEVYAEAGDEVTPELIESFLESGQCDLSVLHMNMVNKGPFIRNTLKVGKSSDKLSALEEIYRVMRPGEPPTLETATALLDSLFFNSDRYDLSPVGRVKMNLRLNMECSDDVRVLRTEDIVMVMKKLVDLRDGKGEVDDIDNLANRRVRSVGELMENQYRIGLLRMNRAIKERMSSTDIDTVLPQDLINAKPVVAAVREFFGSSQLSQFMDQTNPLSEITHKRRLSTLGPGGLTRERAGFEVRDVHPTHYSRICPIESPEGPNIGLINSLALFASVNEYGFIESPYRKVENGRVLDEVVYLSAMEESRYRLAQATIPVDKNGKITDELVNCRVNGNFEVVTPDLVNFVDVSPKQIVSVAAALIPFIENDDANRALMGSNMMRQAVPLLQADAPLVGTGMESVVAQNSSAVVIARRTGIVDQVDAMRIVVRITGVFDASQSTIDIYNLRKFQRSNQSTCINQRPLVRVGDEVAVGDVLADGPSTELGELALGRNVLVAFMPWNGYNFEDSILISERIVWDDVFTSVHIEEFEVIARDTKLGPEEITRDIPNVSEDALRNIDESGIVYIGSEVNVGDILVGKITPKSENPMTPEEKLLRAIFGEKSSDVRDTSMRLSPGVSGIVVDVRVFNRHGIEKDERAMAIEREEIVILSKDRDAELKIFERNIYDRLKEMLVDQQVMNSFKDIKKNVTLTDRLLKEVPRSQWWKIELKDNKVMSDIETLHKQFSDSKDVLEKRFEDKVDKLQRGDELPPGGMKMVKVYVAVKRKLQPGDKMAGRHGNKGVISRILPVEDMPYLEDGTPIDIVLNPLGVPSRMNVGQILETHLGWACAGLGKQVSAAISAYEYGHKTAQDVKNVLKEIYPNNAIIENLSDGEALEMSYTLRKGVPMATPVFDGAKEEDIVDVLSKAGLASSGQVVLCDGRTGELFDRKITVGYIYMLKLHHLVDDKIHARSIGPYSLVTQQPLGGKALFGGQRFGEMEVWALEAYGAAYTLQEMLTVKSDDVSGRTKVYEAIVKGDDAFEAGIPESFNVLIKEMRSLGLSVDLTTRQDDER